MTDGLTPDPPHNPNLHFAEEPTAADVEMLQARIASTLNNGTDSSCQTTPPDFQVKLLDLYVAFIARHMGT